MVGTGGRDSSRTTGKWDERPATLGFSAGLREEATGVNSSWHLPLSVWGGGVLVSPHAQAGPLKGNRNLEKEIQKEETRAGGQRVVTS